ncbi:MAG: hypothetical protein AAF940_09490 [Pseudomonadota bacterium]
MTIWHSINKMTPKVPAILPAHWLIRIPVAGIILQQAAWKLPLSAGDAEVYGLPLFAWALATLGELGAGIGLLLGGLLPGRVGDVLTRISGAVIAIVVVGVLYVAYAAPLMDILTLNQLQIMLLVGGLFFALRGNERFTPTMRRPRITLQAAE